MLKVESSELKQTEKLLEMDGEVQEATKHQHIFLKKVVQDGVLAPRQQFRKQRQGTGVLSLIVVIGN